MLHLLKLELKKVNNYRPFQVMALLYLIALPASLLVTKSLPEEIGMFFGSQGFYTFPNVWRFLGYIGNWIGFFFLGFMGVLSITSEYGNKTLRQNIITGLTRKDYFFAKVVFIAAISLAATVYYFLVGTTIGLAHADPFYFDVFTQNLDYIPRFFLMCFGYMSLGLLSGTLVRRTGFAIFLFLAYGIFIETILRGIHLYYLEHRSCIFYPVNALEDLTPIPFPDMANEMIKEMEFHPFMSATEAIVTSSIFTFIFLFGVYQLLMKRDL